ncbi:MAG: NAD-dependent deacylase [Prevotella sp.]|nr:NAD-dependent deacylase [Prevotella sp.]
MAKKKIVFLTGAGMSVESGFKTFRGNDGLWEEYPVEQVASHEGWLADPVLVNNFYNRLRRKLYDAKPNEGHRIISAMEKDYDVVVVTQNVDNLHESAGSTNIVHLHGELTKVCSSRDQFDERYVKELTPDNCEVAPGEKAGDGSLLRPYIVFFGESVPMIGVAAECASEADVFVIIGTSLNVYPAAGLIHYVRPGVPVYLIDPNPVDAAVGKKVTHLQMGASEGMRKLVEILSGKKA